MNRREFLIKTAAGASGALVAASGIRAGSSPNRKMRRTGEGKTDTSLALPARLGTYYEAEVPDTLDLAERARLGINHFTSIIREENDYEMYWVGSFGVSSLPIMTCDIHPLLNCQPKAMEAMAFLRLMSGSQQHVEREAEMVEMLASHIGDDGIFYVPPTSGRKPWLGPEELRPYGAMQGNGRMMRAMVAWYQYTGDPVWKERIDGMVDGWDRDMVFHKEDYAYFPVYGWMDAEYFRSCYMKGRGWRDTVEPTGEKFGEEGSLFNHQGHMPGVLANWYLLTGNKRALRLSGELVRFLTKPKFWADWPGGEYPGVVGAEHAHWQGHFHGFINTLRAILEYAIATNDSRLKQFVRDGYEWARQPVLARIGFVGDGQSCGCGRLIGLAVKLTYAGLGDYWEDVDLYIRNHATEMQYTPEDIPYLEKLGEGKPPPTLGPSNSSVGVMEASMGGFPGNPSKQVWFLCCSPHGNMGLFYAWDGTLRYADGVAQVNLLLNRVSSWMDVDSYLPYEGKVVLRNKACREAFVRIPLWVETKTVGCHVNGRIVHREWFGRYLRVEHLKAGDVVTIEFPVVERSEKWTSPGQLGGWWPGYPANTVFTFRFKGNTLIEISPSPTQLSAIPNGSTGWLYHDRAEKYQGNKTPMKQVTRFVTPKVLRW